MKLRVGNGAVGGYRRLPYKVWYAIAEFVDNSIDAYLRKGNKGALDKDFRANGEVLTVQVEYDKKSKILRIEDNSFGMDREILEAALEIATPSKQTAGLSEYGMGMKTAAIWFASQMEIRTKKIGDPKELRILIDFDEFIAGNVDDFEITETTRPSDHHYTIIELRGLLRNLGESGFGKARQFIGSIYREFLREGILKISVGGEEILAPPGKDDIDQFLKRKDETPYVIPITETVAGKSVTGWIGVLGPSFGGRNKAGFALIRRKRTIRGWVDSWRPELIFGEGARNDTINQRIVGELHLDSFPVSHTKDAIDWLDDDEDTLAKKVKQAAERAGLIKAAKANFKDGAPEDPIEGAAAKKQIEAEWRSPQVQDELQILDVPRPEIVAVTNSPLLDAVANAHKVVDFKLSQGKVANLVEVEISVNDPYYTYEIDASGNLLVIVNIAHPAHSLFATAEAIMANYHHILADAVAEWNCESQNEEVRPESIRLQKERIFRAIRNSNEFIE